MKTVFLGRFPFGKGVLSLLLLGSLLAGCGQTGPLYLPAPEEQEKTKEQS